MILVNGCPKHGNHALQKAVGLLGENAGPILHFSPYDDLPTGITHHLFVYRDPRNALISWMRTNCRPVTSGMIIAEIKNGEFIQQMALFSPWMGRDVYKIKFEDLIEDDLCMRALASHLGVPYREDAFPNLRGYTRTWTGSLSDFSAHWDEEIDSVWRNVGGDIVVKAYGYEPWNC